MKVTTIVVGMILIATTITSATIMKTDRKIENDNKLNELNAYQNVKPIELQSLGKIDCVAATKKNIPLSLLPKSADIPVSSAEMDGIHPTIASDLEGNLFAAYVGASDLFTCDIYMAVSTDNGNNWDIAGFWNLDGTIEDYPTFDYTGQGTRFMGTWMPDSDDSQGAAMYICDIPDINDITTWTWSGWDWTNYGYYEYNDPVISCYDLPDWDVPGGVICNTIDGEDAEIGTYEDTPVFNWPSVDEGYYWIWGWGDTFTNAAHPGSSVDRSNGMWYGVWDWQNTTTSSRDIIIAKMDTHDLANQNWEAIRWLAIEDSSVEFTYPSVAAANGNVYIACQYDNLGIGNQDIYCYISTDGGMTWISSPVATTVDNELYPTVIAYGESATCTFIKNGDLYYSHTADGGITWSAIERVNDNSGIVLDEYRTADLTNGGDVVWTDNSNTPLLIYYDNVGIPAPVISIIETKGGFGITASITNVGGVNGENIPWSITFDGLVFVGKEKTGVINVAVGETTTIKTGFVLGVGPVSVIIDVGGTQATISGFALGPLILGVE